MFHWYRFSRAFPSIIQILTGVNIHKKASEAVDWMLKHLAFRNRKEGVELGKVLVKQKLIEHYGDPQPFQDNGEYFRFTVSLFYYHLQNPIAQLFCNYNPLGSPTNYIYFQK